MREHRITAVQAGTSAGDYGHTGLDWSNPAATHTFAGRAIRLDQAEWKRLGFEGTAVYDVLIIVPVDEMPAGLSQAGASTSWRITNIVSDDGVVFLDGNIDVNEVTPQVGPLGRVRFWRIWGKVVK